MREIERPFRSLQYRRRECNRYRASKSVFNTFYTRAHTSARCTLDVEFQSPLPGQLEFCLLEIF